MNHSLLQASGKYRRPPSSQLKALIGECTLAKENIHCIWFIHAEITAMDLKLFLPFLQAIYHIKMYCGHRRDKNPKESV